MFFRRAKVVVLPATCLALLPLPSMGVAYAQGYGGYRPLDAGCDLKKNVKGGTQDIPKPQRGGVLSSTGFEFYDGRPGEPYGRARYGGERSAFTSKKKARLDLQFTLAGMVLDAGHRWFEPGEILGQDGPMAGQLGGNLFGINSDREMVGDVFFCDAPARYTQDAVEVYNRLGAQLLGDRFTSRSGPAPTVLMWRDQNTIKPW